MFGIGNEINASTLAGLAWQPEAAPLRDGLATAADRTSVADGVSRMLAAADRAGAGLGRETGGRELVASEDSVTAGGVRDAYDLQLYRNPDGTYVLELDMSIDFNFVDGEDGLNWTADEKQQFIEDYKHVVLESWDGHTITTDDGQEVELSINLDINEQRSGLFGGMLERLDGQENWSVDIIRIEEGGFSQSYVIPSQNKGVFDSEDVRPVNKGASDPQVGAAHEFGHMIGLPDEYNGSAGPEAAKDTDSLMHTGMDVRERHLDLLETWIEDLN